VNNPANLVRRIQAEAGTLCEKQELLVRQPRRWEFTRKLKPTEVRTAKLSRIPTRQWLDCTPNHVFELWLEEFLEADGDRLKRQPLQHAANKCMDYKAARFRISDPV
jgi:hypothetical protein